MAQTLAEYAPTIQRVDMAGGAFTIGVAALTAFTPLNSMLTCIPLALAAIVSFDFRSSANELVL